jgi:hypothetical protein
MLREYKLRLRLTPHTGIRQAYLKSLGGEHDGETNRSRAVAAGAVQRRAAGRQAEGGESPSFCTFRKAHCGAFWPGCERAGTPRGQDNQ